jgi:hypothetical protein
VKRKRRSSPRFQARPPRRRCRGPRSRTGVGGPQPLRGPRPRDAEGVRVAGVGVGDRPRRGIDHGVEEREVHLRVLQLVDQPGAVRCAAPPPGSPSEAWMATALMVSAMISAAPKPWLETSPIITPSRPPGAGRGGRSRRPPSPPGRSARPPPRSRRTAPAAGSSLSWRSCASSISRTTPLLRRLSATSRLFSTAAPIWLAMAEISFWSPAEKRRPVPTPDEVDDAHGARLALGRRVADRNGEEGAAHRMLGLAPVAAVLVVGSQVHRADVAEHRRGRGAGIVQGDRPGLPVAAHHGRQHQLPRLGPVHPQRGPRAPRMLATSLRIVRAASSSEMMEPRISLME